MHMNVCVGEIDRSKEREKRKKADGVTLDYTRGLDKGVGSCSLPSLCSMEAMVLA